MALRIIVDLFDASDVFSVSDIDAALRLVRDNVVNDIEDGMEDTPGGVRVQWATTETDAVQCEANARKGAHL